jgi:hypothetical protein
MGGPQLGTYVTHPDQMNVLYPSNVDDSGISSTACTEMPNLGVPTEMTYTIAKIEFSTIIRELIDCTNTAGVEIDNLEYGQTLTFDKKLNDLFTKFPCYSQYDGNGQSGNGAIYREKPFLKWQRDFFFFALHTRLARLHRPFLLKGSGDTRYEYSRVACLHSTRIVIEMYPELRRVPCGHVWVVIYQLFLATVTLVMDYCYHHGDPHESERRSEILQCYEILERDSNDPVMRRGLTQLGQVIDRWRAGGEGADSRSNRKPLEQWTDANPTSSTLNQSNAYPAADNVTQTNGLSETSFIPNLEFWESTLDPYLGLDGVALFHDLDRHPGSSFDLMHTY